MKKVITTVGTSIFENYLTKKNDIDTLYQAIKDKRHQNWDSQKERIDFIKKSVAPWANNNTGASAEIKSIVKIKDYLKEEIEVHLLATDSITSRLSAELTIEWFKEHDKQITITFAPENDTIENLQVADYKGLIKEGLPNFINRINWIAGAGSDSIGYWGNIIFNITGGYKALIPYMTIMAAVNSCEIAYIFEETDSLIFIPPLPITIDFEVFKSNLEAIKQLDDGIENYNKAKQTNFKSFSELEEKGLVEQVDDLAFLSPVGKIFYEKFKEKFFVFYAPDDVNNEIKQQQEITRILKTKFAKGIYKKKTETKGEHHVYDDGNNNNRIYYFQHEGNIYIYKTFESEEAAREFISQPINKEKIIHQSKRRIMESTIKNSP